jgi:hypothetical protein
MPRALKAAAQRDARRGTQWGTQDYTEGTQLMSRGTQGTLWVVGCTLGYPGVYTHARAHARSLSARL